LNSTAVIGSNGCWNRDLELSDSAMSYPAAAG
jgi:hypothetical protein